MVVGSTQRASASSSARVTALQRMRQDACGRSIKTLDEQTACLLGKSIVTRSRVAGMQLILSARRYPTKDSFGSAALARCLARGQRSHCLPFRGAPRLALAIAPRFAVRAPPTLPPVGGTAHCEKTNPTRKGPGLTFAVFHTIIHVRKCDTVICGHNSRTCQSMIRCT